MKGGVVPGGISVNARLVSAVTSAFCQGHIGAVIEGEFSTNSDLRYYSFL